MKLHVEVQLPQGAITIQDPLESGQDVQLAPHGNFQYEYYFYFPEAGDFTHYPTHVSNYEEIIAFASPTILRVRPAGQQTNVFGDTTSWSYVLACGSQEDILRKLATDPLDGMNIDLLIPKLHRDATFLQSVTEVLRRRGEFIDRIWSMALVWGSFGGEQEPWRLRLAGEYIIGTGKAELVGDWFTSPVLTRKPRATSESTRIFRYLEYFPLINARGMYKRIHFLLTLHELPE